MVSSFLRADLLDGIPHGFSTSAGLEADDIVRGANLMCPRQIHSATVVIVDEPWPEPPQADALVTARRGIALGIVTADCAPVLLSDAKAGVVGAAHAGWRGAVGGVLEHTVAAMVSLGAHAPDIKAAIGPTIAQGSYEVDQGFREQFDNREARFFAAGRLFDDADFVIDWHPADRNSAASRMSLANRSGKFRFRGVSAHAAGAPERGRSALDGVEAMNMMVNMMREHTSMDTRIHYVITDGGKAPNVVPDFAEVFYYVRHSDADEVRALWPRLEAAAKGAAMGTGTEVDWEIIHGNNPTLPVESLQKMMDAKLRQLEPLKYTADELAWAATIRESLGDDAPELAEAAEIEDYAVLTGYGSTDVGDVSRAVPTVSVRTATWVPGTAAHSWQAVAASGHSYGAKGTQHAAKAMMLAAVELYTNPQLRETAKAEFIAARGEDYVYESLLGDRAPPLDYRK